jgi:hypothetical protein
MKQHWSQLIGLYDNAAEKSSFHFATWNKLKGLMVDNCSRRIFGKQMGASLMFYGGNNLATATHLAQEFLKKEISIEITFFSYIIELHVTATIVQELLIRSRKEKERTYKNIVRVFEH